MVDCVPIGLDACTKSGWFDILVIMLILGTIIGGIMIYIDYKNEMNETKNIKREEISNK